MFGDVLEAECEALAKELGDAAHVVPLDVTLEDHCGRRGRVHEDQLGGLHVLVNNAGIGAGTPIVGGPLDDYIARDHDQPGRRVAGHAARTPVMGESGGGSIVNISSIDGIIGMANAGGYVSAKFAVRG